MATTSDFRTGLCLEFNNDLYTIVEFQHVKPGKGGAFVRTKLKSLTSGKVIDNTFNAGVKITIARIERRPYQFLYKDGSGYHCMDQNTFDQLILEEQDIDNPLLLKDGQELDILFHGESGKLIGCELPPFVNLRVTYTEPGFKGDTATRALKPATLETGLTVQVPLFIDNEELLKIDTRTITYVEQELISFIAKSGLDEVNIETEQIKINVKKNSALPVVQQIVGSQTPASLVVNPGTVATAALSSVAAPQAATEAAYVTFKSPMIGTFYRSSNPESAPFVKEGDAIKPGQSLCIIEAMKLFNEIEAEVTGTIVKVLVEDASPVEYDQPLFLIHPVS
eukprot:gene73-99_t